MSKKQGIKTIYPLSPLQEGIVFHTLYDQNPKVYFEQISFAVVGDFDHQLFVEAYKALCDRHDILRTIIAHEKLSKPMQVVLHSLEFDIYEKDISDLSDEECEEFVESYKENDINKGFQMVGIALHRLALFTQQGKFHVVWSHHHSLLDGWSVELLLKEWFQIYWAKVEGGNALLGKPEPFRSYVDWLEKQDKNGAADYWEKFTTGYEEKASLPFRKMSSEREGSHFKRIDFAFNEEVTSQLKDLSRTTGVTLNTVIQTLWGILLQKYSGHEDVIFGTVVSGRPASVIDIEKMVGLFINTIPVRVSAERDASLPEVMRLIQEGSLESEAYNFFPLYEIQALSSLKQDLMDHVLVFENYPNRFNWEGINDDEHGFHIEGVSRFEETNFSFGLIVHPSDRLEFSILYDTLKYESDGIENIPNHMLCLVESMLDSPNGKISEYEIVPQSELKQLENYMGENEWFDRDVTIQELFEKQVEKAPDQIALITGDISWTYFELNRKANCIAHHLRHDIGIKPGMLVGIMTDRSSEMIAGILGIWKAGGAYLPLDPDYPEDRLSYIISDSGVEWVLSQTNMKNLLQSLGVNGLYLDEATFQKQEITFENLSVVNQPDDLAYIIYTSGSTGRPKGVMVEHRGVSNLSEAFKKELQIVQDDRILLFASISFDASVLELAESILQGATLCIPNNETIHDPWEMTQWMTTHQVTIATFPPGFAVYLDVEQMPYLRVLITAGSSSSMNLVEKFKSIRYINAYGPTEYTVCSALWNFNSDEMLDKNVPIGKPIANTEIFIMNRWGQQQPIGVVGELCIAGVGLARGYLNRSDLTAEKFVEHPYKPEERMYKTGDLARWLPNGNLEYFGRVDHQVKIRGFRIEIGEIESAMQRLSGVQDAVVLARNDKEGQLYLVAYVVMGTETTSMDVNMIRSGLKKELPDFMVPERFIALEKLPFTPNGKVDRKALPEPKDGMTSGRAYAAPRDEWETKMVQVWQDVLVRERISIYDHFFELGGHSLKAMALVSALQKQLQIEMPLRQIFNTPILHDLAQYAARAAQSRFEPIQPLAPKTTYLVSSAQRRLLILNQIGEKQTSYNMPMAVRLQGDLDVEKLETALQRMVERHEALRTSFTWVDGEPLQIIHENVPYRLERLGQLEASEKLGSSLRQKLSELIQPFDLQQAPLMRTWLAEQGQSDYVLVMDMHHIISDGVSTALFWDELSRIYRGETLEPLELSYKDYAAWEQAQMDSESMKDQESYWLDQLSGELPILELPLDRPRPLVQSFEGDRITFELEKETTDRLQELAAKSGSTLYMVLMAAFQVWLTRYSGQEDIVVGTTIAGRRHADTERMLGMFVNTLALRGAPTREKTFTAFLSEVKTTLLQAYENQEYAFDRLVEKLEVRRDASRNPLFDALFSMQNTAIGDWGLSELKLDPLEIEWSISKFDLTLEAWETDVGIVFGLEYASQLFDRTTVQRMGDHWLKLLQEIASEMELTIGAIEMISEPEREELHRFNRTEVPLDIEKTAADWFEEQVAERPEATALIFNETCWTYDELNRLANRVAWHLQASGIGTGRLVGIMADRSVELIAGILGVWKAGGAYVPLDPDYPEERIAYMLMDSGVDVVLTQSHLEERVTQHGVSSVCMEALAEEAEEVVNPMRTNAAGDIAYVIYTSGSTGKPKGVMVEHRGVVNLRQALRNQMNITPSERILQFASISFDVSVAEIVQSLLSGGVLCMPDRETVRDAWKLTQWMAEKQVTIATLPPGFALYVDVQHLPKLRMLITAGSAATESLLEHTKGITYFNAYGPTESTVYATMWQRPAGQTQGSVPIGGPIDNTETYIIDEAGRMQPIGVVGELCIAGIGLARGYLNRAELTAEKFVTHPNKPGERMYKTGDFARWLPDGTLEYLGRKDDQLKIRGYRIEIGEIEAALDQMDGVREAVVVPRKDQEEQVYLCAYCVPVEEGTTGSQLRSGLLRILPEYMVPSRIVIMSQLPLTSNGKVDKKALPEPEEAKAARTSYVAPRTQMEEDMVEIWQEVLGVSQVSVDDHFFELGGDSIKAIQINARLYKKRLNLETRHLFKHPILEDVVKYVKALERKAAQNVAGSILPTPIQSWFFEQEFDQPEHWNQAIMTCKKSGYNPKYLSDSLSYLVAQHDALRISCQTERNSFELKYEEVIDTSTVFNIFDFRDEVELHERIREEANKLQSSFQLDNPPLFRVGLFQTNAGDYLLLIAHHLIIDGVSWRIILDDLHEIYDQIEAGKSPVSPDKTDSFQAWSHLLKQYVNDPKFEEDSTYWKKMANYEPQRLRTEGQAWSGCWKDSRTVSIRLNYEETQGLMTEAHKAYNTEMNDLLLSALVCTMKTKMGLDRFGVMMEGHGRENLDADINVSRTVGWFTSLFPVFLSHSSGELGELIKETKETIRQIPKHGIGYGMMKYLSSSESSFPFKSDLEPEVCFNYLGEFSSGKGFELSSYDVGTVIGGINKRSFVWDFVAIVEDGEMKINLTFNGGEFLEETMMGILKEYSQQLREVSQYCREKNETEHTPSDYTMKISQSELDELAQEIEFSID